MPLAVVMPRLGWNMESGSLGEWLKKDGEYVKAGEPLFTVEGDKAVREVEALESGILCIPPDSPPPGKEVPVGTLLAYLLQPGERAPFEVGVASSAAGMKAEAQKAGEPEGITSGRGSGEGVARSVRQAISPRARRVARELGVDWTRLAGSGRAGRIVERDVRAAAAYRRPAEARVHVGPLARRVAEEWVMGLAQSATRMPGERPEVADVKAATAGGHVPVPPGVASPITPMRRAIAERMAASAHTVAAVTLTTEADATELVRLRRQWKKSAEASGSAGTGMFPIPSYNDLLAKLVAQALLEHPALNARLEGDRIVQATTVNIGIAVDTERGLLVPVVHDVHMKSLRQVAREAAELIAKARSGRISPAELQGGTFTITDLGMYDIDAFTPIINLPECAILGVGRIVPKQMVIDAEAGQVGIRQMVFLSLTFDHRLVDGAPAARFLQRVKRYVEQPYLWLVGGLDSAFAAVGYGSGALRDGEQENLVGPAEAAKLEMAS
jgi:pyruvate dehydrogenase E2 component (dihydrolipoamide acetyltransferase)